MDKKTMLKVFGEAFLRSLIVLLAVAILGFGAFFLIRINKDNKAKEEMAQNATEQTTYSDEELQAMIDAENAIDAEESSSEETTTEEVTTEEVTTEAPNIPSNDKNIIVLNSTSTSGLAGAWASKLNQEGFPNVAVGNYSAATEQQTKIYVAEEGMGIDLSSYFNGTTISVGTVDSSIFSVKSGAMDHYDIFIVIGNSDTTVQ